MRHFVPIAANIDVVPLMNVLAVRPELWNQNRARTTYQDSPHAQVSDIWLRFHADNGQDISSYPDELETVWFPAANVLLPARRIVSDLMARLSAERLGRVIITRLPPGGRIAAHRDNTGRYANYYTRYHVALLGKDGSVFRAGNETVSMKTGEAWWFDASAEHEITNNSDDDRINLLIDVKLP